MSETIDLRRRLGPILLFSPVGVILRDELHPDRPPPGRVPVVLDVHESADNPRVLPRPFGLDAPGWLPTDLAPTRVADGRIAFTGLGRTSRSTARVRWYRLRFHALGPGPALAPGLVDPPLPEFVRPFGMVIRRPTPSDQDPDATQTIPVDWPNPMVVLFSAPPHGPGLPEPVPPLRPTVAVVAMVPAPNDPGLPHGVRGRVVGPGARPVPVAHAKLELRARDHSGGLGSLFTTVTEADGTYRIPVPTLLKTSERSYRLKATDPTNFRTGSRRVTTENVGGPIEVQIGHDD